MGSKVLAELVTRVVTTGTAEKLSDDKNRQFHSEFQAEVSGKIDEMRAEKRRVYEEIKNIVLR